MPSFPGESQRRRAATGIAVAVAAVFMANLDLWIVNLALPEMGRGLDATLAALSWVVNAYAMALAALLVPAGRLGDRVGHRRVFLAGLALFTAASAGCAAAPDVLLLVVARVVQAAGAAALVPTSLALLLAAVEPQRRMHAARLWSAVGALAAVAGPVLGGLLVTASWRWVFLVNIPIGVAAWVLARRTLPRLHPSAGPLPDLAGSALLVLAVGALVGAFVQAPEWGWTDLRTIAALVLAVAGVAGFVLRCRTHPTPLVEPALLRVPRFATANVAVFLFGAAFAIMLLSNSLWCQDVWQYSPLRAGLAMVPGPAMVPIVTIASTRLVRRFGAGTVAAAGSLLFAASPLWRIVLAEPQPDYLRDLLPSTLLGGAGVGLALGTLIAAGATALPDGRSATGSAILNSVRQIASALGVAVLVTILGPATGVVSGYQAGWAVGVGLALAAGAASVALARHTRQREVVA